MTTGTIDTEARMQEHDDDPIAATKKLLRSYAGAIIATFLLTAMLIIGAILAVERDGQTVFSQTSDDMLRDRLSVEEHMDGLARLYWFPEQQPLIANLHNGTFADSEIVALSDDQIVRAADLLDGTASDELSERLRELDIDERVTGFLTRLQATDGLRENTDGTPAIPATYEITRITHWAGMRIYAEDGMKTFERDLPVRATLIGVDHPAYDPAHRVATIEAIAR